MLDLDEDAVICDLAETYHIHDMYQYPCTHIATLAQGLRNDSRIKIKLSGLRISPELFALGACADAMRTLVWFQTKDGFKGRNRPKSILDALSGEPKEKELRGFRSGDDFMAEWNRLGGEEEE